MWDCPEQGRGVASGHAKSQLQVITWGGANGVLGVSRVKLCFLPPQGLELCRVIATHMESLLFAREKRLTLPPSEITLL